MSKNNTFNIEEESFEMSPAETKYFFANLPSNRQSFVQSGIYDNTLDVFINDTIDILINRHNESPKSTLGTLSVSKFNFNGYTLERPGPDTTTRAIRLRIPIGTYKVQWHTTRLNKKLGKAFKLYNENVPADRYILIDIGNGPDNTDGCILIGRTQSANFVGGNSTQTIYDFYDLFEDVDIDQVRVKITESY